MKILCVVSPKGGTGKTTMSAHLARAALDAGAGPVVLFDTDPQKSLAAWWNVRKAGDIKFGNLANLGQLPQALDTVAPHFGLAIIDTPPAMTGEIRAVVGVADLVLILTRPSPIDLRALGTGIELVKAEAKPMVFAVNACKPTARLTVQTVGLLSRHGPVCPTPVASREGFAAAMTDGRTIHDLEPRGKGAREVADLWQFVSDFLPKEPVE